MEFFQNLIDKEVLFASTVRDEESKVKFSPAVYEQRYHRVVNLLESERITKHVKNVVEFGVAEMKSFTIFKNGLKHLNRMDLVDIDVDLLETHKSRANPLICEYINKRKRPLTVNVWQGSVSVFNPNFADADAVIAIELIEHVFPSVFEEIPYNIFEAIKPKIAIFTTPNSDFNELFEMPPGTFRHYDHKFEWSRSEFQDWAENICARFPDFQVIFTGIGVAPSGSAHLGCCSQMAVFIRKDFLGLIDTPAAADETEVQTEINKELIECDNYKLIHSVEYPFFNDLRSHEEKLNDEIQNLVENYRWNEDEYFNYELDRIEIPINFVVSGCWKISENEEEISAIIKEKYKTENELIIFPPNERENDENYSDHEDNST